MINVVDLGKRYRIGVGNIAAADARETVTRLLAKVVGRTSNSGSETGPSKGRQAGELFWALRGVSFSVPEGEVVGVVGRNGSGKSTLLKLLAGITEPTEGRAELAGRIGSLLEVGTGFHPELTGRENVFLSGAILGMQKEEIAQKLSDIIAFAEVERFVDTPVKFYSSGMYLRLAFSVAAHLETEILLIDEVLAVGDASFQQKCLSKMAALAESGRTILFVSHNLAAIRRLCRSALLLDGGRLVVQGTVEEILQRYSTLMETPETASAQGENGLRIHGIKAGEGDRRPIASGSGWPLRFSLDVPEQMQSLSVRISLRDAENRLIAHSRLEDSVPLGAVESGVLRIQVLFPPMWLTPSQYAVQIKAIGMTSQQDQLRTVSDPFAVSVVNERLGRVELPGILTPSTEWTVEMEE